LSQVSDSKETVVLVHGLWFPGIVLAPLARRLARAGFSVVSFSYPSVRADLRANAERLNAFLAGLDAGTVHLVGHSLGGILIRALFHHFPAQRPGRVVTLAAPHQGSRAGQRLARLRLGRRILGYGVAQLLAGAPAVWALPAREIGTVSGTHSIGLGRLVGGMERPNDGLLSVAETTLPGAHARLVLPVAHTGMLFSRPVADAVGRFLRAGLF
jgi:pimeloyl-ACP methyl ester carboxylesterase